MKLNWRCTKVGLHIIFWRHFKAELSKLQNIRRLMRGDLLGVPRSSRIHEICGGNKDEHEEHNEHATQIEGKHTHTRYTPVVLTGPIHQLNRITRKRLQE
jgi:hypothetical protein